MESITTITAETWHTSSVKKDIFQQFHGFRSSFVFTGNYVQNGFALSDIPLGMLWVNSVITFSGFKPSDRKTTDGIDWYSAPTAFTNNTNATVANPRPLFPNSTATQQSHNTVYRDITS